MQLIFGGANGKVYLTKNLYHVKTSLRKKRLTTLPHPQMILIFRIYPMEAKIGRHFGQNEYLSNRAELRLGKYIFGHPKLSN